MTKRESNKLDKAVEAAFQVHGNRVQFSVMDLGKISNETRAAVIAGGDINEAMKAAVAKYRKN
jgi:xanthine dehydrogenase molybdopterin-binding subunit B